MLQSFLCTLLNEDTQMFHCDKKHKTKKRKYKIQICFNTDSQYLDNVKC